MRGVREAPFIVLIGRFPGEISAGTLATDFSKAVATFLPRLRGPRTHLGAHWPVILSDPSKGGGASFHIRRWREPTFEAIKGASTHPLMAFIHPITYTRRRSSSRTPLVSLE